MAEGLAFSFTRQCPVVTHLHGSLADVQRVYQWPLDRDMRLAIFLESTCIRKSDHVTAATVGSLPNGSLGRSMARKSVTIVPHPMPCDGHHGIPVSRTRPWVLFVGRLEANKNAAVIVRAAPLVLKEVPDAKFIFVGQDNGDMEKLRAIADASGAGSSMEWKGRLERAEIEPLRGHARVCVVPSRRETFGLVATEAMAAGRPVIGSRIDGLCDIIRDGETGILVDPEDSTQWAAAMIRMLTDPTLASVMGERAYRDVQERFNPEQIVARREAVYLRTLSAWTGRRLRPRSMQTEPSPTAVSRVMFNLLPSLTEATGVAKTTQPPLQGTGRS